MQSNRQSLLNPKKEANKDNESNKNNTTSDSAQALTDTETSFKAFDVESPESPNNSSSGSGCTCHNDPCCCIIMMNSSNGSHHSNGGCLDLCTFCGGGNCDCKGDIRGAAAAICLGVALGLTIGLSAWCVYYTCQELVKSYKESIQDFALRFAIVATFTAAAFYAFASASESMGDLARKDHGDTAASITALCFHTWFTTVGAGIGAYLSSFIKCRRSNEAVSVASNRYSQFAVVTPAPDAPPPYSAISIQPLPPPSAPAYNS